MVTQLIKKERADFRVVLKELKTGKSKTLSLKSQAKLEDLEKRIGDCLEGK